MEWSYNSTFYWCSVLDVGGWRDACPDHFIPEKGPPIFPGRRLCGSQISSGHSVEEDTVHPCRESELVSMVCSR